MTLNQLESLTEDELAMCLYVVNVLFPLDIPKMELQPQHLTWFRQGALEEKLKQAFPKVRREAHPIFSSLLNKLGVQHEIRYEQVPTPPTGSNPVTSSV